MRTIGIRNLRALEDIQNIKISPLTMLVGKNSSGKSTFLRYFPLMKQSVMNDIQEAILWYGDYVDFGTFKDSLTKGNEDTEMEFKFSFVIDKENREDGFYGFRHNYFRPFRYRNDLEVNLTVRLNNEHFTFIKFSYGDQKIEVKFESPITPEYLIINDELQEVKDLIFLKDAKKFLPYPIFYDFDKKKNTQNSYRDRVIQNLLSHSHSNTSRNRIIDSVQRVVVGDSDEVYKSLISSGLPKSTLKKLNRESIESILSLNELNNAIMLNSLRDLFEIVDKNLKNYFLSVNYIKPIRAHGERYYRYQGLSVKDIDPSGNNIPAYLDSLSSHFKSRFKEWCLSTFGFYFYSKKSGGHFSIILSYGNDNDEQNLTDLGFGFSQILPIVVLLWEIEKQEKIKKHIIAIEQPELHLHPGLQKKLIRIFAEIISKYNSNSKKVSFILETHSESMINEVGKLVFNGSIDKSDVNVCIFEKEEESTIITQLQFNEKGYLERWPIGFFE